MTGELRDGPLVSEIEVDGLQGQVFASRRPRETPADATVPAAPAVVLIHGIGVSHRYLARLHRLLSRSVDTYSIDLPGFGSTPRPEHQLTVPDYAAYILGALAQVGVHEFVLVGHSMGSQFAIEAALQEPERIRHLVLMGPVVDSRRRSVPRQALALGIDSLFFETPSSNFLVASDYFRCGLSWYLKTLQVMMDYPTEERIPGVRAPVLVIRGANDPVAGAIWCRRLAARAAGGRLLEVPNNGHVVQHTGAGEVAQAITSFASLPAGAPELQP